MLFAPFALLVVLAGWFGWRMGVPVTETQIIEYYVGLYVREFGGVASECQAVPSDLPDVRLEVICAGADETLRFLVGPRGGLVETTGSLPEA